jgi:hypothetical protein
VTAAPGRPHLPAPATTPSPAQPRPPQPARPEMGSGDPRVDDALSRLAELDALPVAEQVEVFTDIHARLAAVLADPDSRA